LTTKLASVRSDFAWKLGRRERIKFSRTAGKAAGGFDGIMWISETGVMSIKLSFEFDISRLARIGTTAEVRRILRWSISCNARSAVNSVEDGTK
jgi:hypothetical protein